MKTAIKFSLVSAAVFMCLLMIGTSLNLFVGLCEAKGNPTARTVDDGVVGLWHFDETSGSQVLDSSKEGNHGTVYGATVGTTANNPESSDFDKCLSFDGTNDYVSCGSDSSLKPSGDVTFECWAYIEGDGGTYQYLLSTGAQTSSTGVYIRYRTDTNKLNLGLKTTSKTVSSGDTISINEDTWIHIAGIYDDSESELYAYIDGELIGTYSTSSGTYSNSYTSLTIGRPNNQATYYFSGKIDEVCITDHTKYISSLIGHWSFDEVHSTSTYDSSHLNNDGTLISGPTPVDGKFGKGLNFDGSNDYVQIDGSNALLKPQELTLSAWIKPDAAQNHDNVLSKAVNYYSSPYYSYGIKIHATGRIALSLNLNSVDRAVTSDVGEEVPFGEWSHVAGTYDGSIMKIYINGELMNSASYSGTITYNNNPVCIGRFRSGACLFDGIIDDVQIHSGALSADVIADMADGYYSKGLYDFDDGSGSVVDDESPYDYDAEIAGGFDGDQNFGGTSISSLQIKSVNYPMLVETNDYYNDWSIKFTNGGTTYTKTVTDYSFSSGT